MPSFIRLLEFSFTLFLVLTFFSNLIMPDSQPLSVLFVCLGNICRSTMAEGVFQNIARKPPYEGLIGEIDSCGTGNQIARSDVSISNLLLTRTGAYHTGEEPDDRTLATLKSHGITNYVHYARKVRPILHASSFTDAQCLI